ncbi:FecR family protein [Sphingomonas pollutisoli]|uniref:FecR family protein n=1 Tax=Sphingomonas pollutisoli TaxID=3030829 RepID=UPI0023B8B612|nr:FecR domain-containing protein [Sphingomonas pollutisoli]
MTMNRTTPMEPTGPRESAADIERAAADWVARLDRGALSDTEQQALASWAAQDTRRAGAYARAMAVNLHLDRAVALGEDYVTRHQPVEAPSRRRVIAVAASAAAACAASLSIFTLQRRGAAPKRRTIGTARGAVREVALGEGSTVTLNTMTELRPSLTDTLRKVDLLKGEALFDVAKDPKRPFVVYVGEFSVRAVGTSFTVRRTALGAVKVVVTEGIVEVTRRQDVLGQVHAGIAFAVDAAASPVIETLNPSQIDSALAWRGGRIDLQGMTLAEAAEEFSRYSDLRIRVTDPAIANLHIAGVYATSDPAGFAENVALSLGLKSVRRGNEVILSKT